MHKGYNKGIIREDVVEKHGIQMLHSVHNSEQHIFKKKCMYLRRLNDNEMFI